MKWYVLSVTITSKDEEQRKLTPYDSYDTALRKFFECFNTIGGGPKKITALLLDADLYVLKSERWELEESEVEESEVEE